ncbi:MAG: RpiB/LacA/LacB family sugar-phosphate isomerase, partial [Ignavibacteria bacterium]
MKKLFTEKEILELNSKGIKTVTISKGDIITPSAMDKIRELNFSIVEGVKADTIDTIYRKAGIKKQGIEKIIAIGSDHTGFTMKGKVSSYLIDKGYKVIDVGTNDESSCDYPDFALAVAEKVKSEEAGFGIILDATGIPSAITANKVPGIRAATCYNEFSARSARE